VLADCEGAVAACTEAIYLDPRSQGAHRTRAEAYSRLGMANEARADLEHLARVSEPVQRPSIELTGTIAKKWEKTYWDDGHQNEMHDAYYIRVSRIAFKLPSTFWKAGVGTYDSLEIGASVVLTVTRPDLTQPLSEAKVMAVRHGTSSTAQQVSEVELWDARRAKRRIQRRMQALYDAITAARN